MEIFDKILDLSDDLEAPDGIGMTPLHHCVGATNQYTLRMAAKLIEAGVNVNALNRSKETPLHSSGVLTDLNAVNLLL